MKDLHPLHVYALQNMEFVTLNRETARFSFYHTIFGCTHSEPPSCRIWKKTCCIGV